MSLFSSAAGHTPETQALIQVLPPWGMLESLKGSAADTCAKEHMEILNSGTAAAQEKAVTALKDLAKLTEGGKDLARGAGGIKPSIPSLSAIFFLKSDDVGKEGGLDHRTKSDDHTAQHKSLNMAVTHSVLAGRTGHRRSRPQRRNCRVSDLHGVTVVTDEADEASPCHSRRTALCLQNLRPGTRWAVGWCSGCDGYRAPEPQAHLTAPYFSRYSLDQQTSSVPWQYLAGQYLGRLGTPVADIPRRYRSGPCYLPGAGQGRPTVLVRCCRHPLVLG